MLPLSCIGESDGRHLSPRRLDRTRYRYLHPAGTVLDGSDGDFNSETKLGEKLYKHDQITVGSVVMMEPNMKE